MTDKLAEAVERVQRYVQNAHKNAAGVDTVEGIAETVVLGHVPRSLMPEGPKP